MKNHELKYIIRETRLLEKRLIARNRKKVKKIFLDFSKKIAIDNGIKYSDEIDAKIILKLDYEWLCNTTKDILESIYLFNLEETIGYFQTVYKKRLDKKVIVGIKDYFLKNWNKKNAASKATRITETTKKKLSSILVEAQEKGLAHKVIVEKIMSAIKGMSEQRADTIARTETSISLNTTNYHIAGQAKMKEKGWIHIGGKKMDRENHKKLNGVFIKMDELFDLGKGIKARYPHDRNLPASEVVRCSCFGVYR